MSAICLSGGGIRSATFNLGVLQHLAHLGILQRFDYLSSVSGGGYIASWLQAWMHHDKRALDQLQEFSRPNAFEPEPQPIRNLREYSNYLTPKLGLFSADTWTAAAMVVRNMLLNWLVLLPAMAAVVAIPWLFLAAVENNDLFRRIDGTFVALATLTELIASILVFRSRRYSTALPYEQGTFVRRCVVPVVLAAALLCVAVLGMSRWITPGLMHPAGDLVVAWTFAGVWCVVNPLLGWSMIELGWFMPKNLPMPHTPPNEKVKKVRRRYEFWGLLASGAITSALLVGVIVYWMAPLYSSPGWYVVLGLPILLSLYLLARTLFVAVASASESPYAAADCGNTNDADREWWARMSGWVLLVAAAWVGITTICLFGPIGLRWLGENVSKFAPAVIGALGGVSGLVTALVGSRDRTNASDAPANGTLATPSSPGRRGTAVRDRLDRDRRVGSRRARLLHRLEAAVAGRCNRLPRLSEHARRPDAVGLPARAHRARRRRVRHGAHRQRQPLFAERLLSQPARARLPGRVARESQCRSVHRFLARRQRPDAHRCSKRSASAASCCRS